MVNRVILIGRLCHNLELKKSEENKKELNLVLAIPRSYKNNDGIYETDFINCKVYENIAIKLSKYCKKGDLLGIRGRLERMNNNMFVIIEKVMFLSN